MVGMTAAHNAVRAMVQTTPAIPPLTWSPTLAAYAQQWADEQAKDPSTCADPMHRSGKDLDAKNYGENLAVSGGSRALMTTAQSAVDGWAAEVACWTYGTITDPGVGGGTEKCDSKCYMDMHSDGCGHYTQVVWRDSTEVGCGVATCQSGRDTNDIWICNYYPGGNFIGEKPY
jgi:pathogenesis-related protein 1